MVRYHSTRGRSAPVAFDVAVLSGFAADGGLFVPQPLPRLSIQRLEEWKSLSYLDLAREVMRGYIDPAIVPDRDLEELLERSFSCFEYQDPPLVLTAEHKNHWIMELFRGPTLSFKDVAMGFLVNLMDYFLARTDERLSLILATTGDTGPAAAYATAGKSRLTCWPLYPAGMISEEQVVQMTAIGATNVHPVEVHGCPNGGDDIDLVVARLFGDDSLKRRLKLSSVNSINIGRVLMQVVHYFYGYFRTAERVGDTVVYSIPAGAIGNLCGGELARAMGLPIEFICATNKNSTLHRLFSEGWFAKKQLQPSVATAIDIVIPYNFWRFLYLRCGAKAGMVTRITDEFERNGSVHIDGQLQQLLREGIVSISVPDQLILDTMRSTFAETGYLLDPHGAVAVAGVESSAHQFPGQTRFVSLATAHPAKFPEVIRLALSGELPGSALHPSIEKAKRAASYGLHFSLEELEQRLVEEIGNSLKG